MSLARHFALIVTIAAPCFVSASAAVPNPSAPIEIADLGQATADTVDVFRVDVRNPACADPQSFRFVPNNLPWLKLTNGNRLASVAHGATKTFVAQIDLSGLKPGRYSGNLDIVCETCGKFTLILCDIDKRRVIVQVEVVRP